MMSRRRAWLVIASSTVLAACGSGSSGPTNIPGVVTTAPGSAASSSAQPAGGSATEAVATFLADLHSGDCQAAYALVVDPLRTRAGSSGGLCGAEAVTGTYTVGASTTLTASSAFVTVTLTGGGISATDTVTVLYQSPHWYVSDVVATSSATPGPGEVSIAHLVAIIEQQYGSPVTVTCPQSGTIQSTPGQQFECTFTDAQGKAGRLTVTIESTHGAFTWSIP
jgi:hypothetical protein